MSPQQDLAVHSRPGHALDIIALATTPEDRRDAARAVVLADSDLVPEAMRGNPAAVLSAMWVCDALDIDRTPLNFGQLYSVHGRPGILAQLQLGLAHRAGHRSRWLTANTDEQCQTLEMDGQSFTYTAAMARKAGLSEDPKKDVWRKHTADMLRARAITRAIKGCCPEVVLGLRSAVPELFEPEPVMGAIDAEAVPADELVPELQAKHLLLDACLSMGLDKETAKREAAHIWAEAHVAGPVHPDYLAKMLADAEALGEPFEADAPPVPGEDGQPLGDGER